MRRYLSGNLLSGAAVASESPHRRTPNHPPYSQMVAMTLQVLSDEGGSTEAAISAHIQSSFTDLPWGHDRLLPYYLGRLVAAGELTSPSTGRYQLPFRLPPSLSSAPSSFTLPRRRGRPPLPRPNPSSSFVFSAPPRGRARRPMRHRRERPPNAHLSEGAPRRRGRPLLRRDGAVGGTPARKLRFRFRSSGSSKRGYDDFVAGNEEGWHCLEADGSSQSKFRSFCGALEDAEEGPSFVAPGQSEQGEERLSPGKGPTLLVLEQLEHGCRQFSLEKEPPFLVPEVSVDHGEGQLSPGELPLSETLEVSAEHGDGQSSPGELPPSATLEVSAEHSDGQSSPGELRLSATLEVSAEHDDGQSSPAELPLSATLEVSAEHGVGQSAGEAPLTTVQSLMVEEQAFVAPEQSEHGKEQAFPGQGLLLPASEEPERSQGPSPDVEEIDESGVSTRQRKPRAKSRRLWFEGLLHLYSFLEVWCSNGKALIC